MKATLTCNECNEKFYSDEDGSWYVEGTTIKCSTCADIENKGNEMNLTARELRHIKEFGRLTASDSCEGYQVTVTSLFTFENGECYHCGVSKYVVMEEGHIRDCGVLNGHDEMPKELIPYVVSKLVTNR